MGHDPRQATEPHPLPTAPRAAPAARACPSPASRAGASVREPGDGAGAQRPGIALALGLQTNLWLHHGRPKKIVFFAHGFCIFWVFRFKVGQKRSVNVKAKGIYGTVDRNSFRAGQNIQFEVRNNQLAVRKICI